MLRNLLASCVLICGLAMFVGCEPPKGNEPPAAPTAEPAAEGAKDQDQSTAEKMMRKKKPPHVTTAK